ncbi:MAG: PD40 domain-containing protein [Bacteroidia bacterium]|nr:PD40 domain-containing protein [Bacteroidia bacterium]
MNSFSRPISKIVMGFFFIGCISGIKAQKSAIDNAGDKIRDFNARQSFYRGDYKTALGTFKDLYNGTPSNAEYAFWVGECYLNMNDHSSAIQYFEKAKQINPNANSNLPLELGKAYRLTGELDKAIAEFEAYKKNVTNIKTLKESEVDHYLGQCNNAKQFLATPVNVKIENLGGDVNSEFDDKRPSITADGKKMIFTSRRPRDKDSHIDKEGDGKYFEDIYMSQWDTVKNAWGEADLVSGSINTEFHDAACSISPDGKQIFVYKNDALEARGGDIWVSRLSSSGRWGSPKT